MKTKLCPTCDDGKGRERPLVLFYRDPKAPDGRAYRCKACMAVRKRVYRVSTYGKALFNGPVWSIPRNA